MIHTRLRCTSHTTTAELQIRANITQSRPLLIFGALSLYFSHVMSHDSATSRH